MATSSTYRGSGGGGGVRKRSRESVAAASLSVPDVYDMAADIGREFEALIDSHGADHVTGLMQKVTVSCIDLDSAYLSMCMLCPLPKF